MTAPSRTAVCSAGDTTHPVHDPPPAATPPASGRAVVADGTGIRCAHRSGECHAGEVPSAETCRRAAESLRRVVAATAGLPDDSPHDAQLRDRLDFAATVLDDLDDEYPS